MYNYSRRKFVKKAAASAAGISILGAYGFRSSHNASANDKVRVAVIGTNSRGAALASGFARTPGVEVGFICDVDDDAIAKGVKAVEDAGFPAPQGVKDFRTVLDNSSIDAVVIAMPDHWHAPATIMSLQAGKHVYLEKPGSHNAREGELVNAAIARYGKVVQMGNQRRSWPAVMRGLVELRSGVIGQPHFARTWYGANRAPIGRGQEVPVPGRLDWELWQGPVPRRPFRDNLVHYNWHWFWHWGTGELLNNGTHFIDLARLGLGVTYPVRVSSLGGRYAYDDDWETPDTQVTVFDFPEGCSISWEGKSCNNRPVENLGAAVSFHSNKGTMVISNTEYIVYDDRNREVERYTAGQDGEVDLTGPGFDMDADHILNFVSAIKNGTSLKSDFADANISVLLCHLGNIAHRTESTLKCDPAGGTIIDNAEASGLWGREYEPGWEPVV